MMSHRRTLSKGHNLEEMLTQHVSLRIRVVLSHGVTHNKLVKRICIDPFLSLLTLTAV